MKAPSHAPSPKVHPACGGTCVAVPLRVEVVSGQDVARFDALLKEHHYLGEGRPAGDYLRQVAIEEGRWVGLLTWGAACYALKDRDRWIGWSATQRAERLKLVVQNRRFLLLSDKGARPNLASQALGAAMRELPAHWRQVFGYEPVLAETFTDIERFAGTCYKASGWEAVGMSQGYARHRADFYVRHGRPKRLWLKKLRPDATKILGGEVLPSAQERGGHSNAHGVMPLNQAQRRSLAQALAEVKDTRQDNRQFELGPVLCIVAMALLCGHRQVAQFVRFGNRLTQIQRAQLGLPRKKRTQYYRAPCYDVYYKLLRQVDPDELAQKLNVWLQQQPQGTLPTALALDGKMIRDTVGVVTLAEHEQGSPRAMSLMSEKEGQGQHCEIKSAQRLLENGPALDHQIVTADALHNQRLTAQIVVEKGGDYLLQVKANQPTLHAYARRCFEGAPFFPHPTNAPTAAWNGARPPASPPRRWKRISPMPAP